MPPALGGGSLAQPTASDWRCLSDGAIVVAAFHPTYQPSQICLSADEELFSAVIRDIDHVLHKLLPPLSTASQSYNLRERKHNYLLPLRTSCLSDHNFFQSLLVSVLFLLSIAFPQLGAFRPQFIKDMCYVLCYVS